MKKEKIKVLIIESDLGWGTNVSDTKEFSTRATAEKFVKIYNYKNNLLEVPDWYMYAKIDEPPKIKLSQYTKFSDIPDGAHFEDKNGKKFIKLISKTAFGIPQKFGRIVAQSEYGPESKLLLFNAVDYDGIIGTCPDFVLFKILKK